MVELNITLDMNVAVAELPGLEWHRYVYRTVNNVVSLDACKTACVIDYDHNSHCHYSVLIDTTCHLGSLGRETNLMAPTAGGEITFHMGEKRTMYVAYTKVLVNFQTPLSATNSLGIHSRVSITNQWQPRD
jgi:hypothetical protein